MQPKIPKIQPKTPTTQPNPPFVVSGFQERFWRINGSLSVEQLRAHAAALSPPPPGEGGDSEGEGEGQGEEPKRPKKKSNARLEMLRAMVKEKQETGQKRR
jgi:hypothetical protein